MMRLIIVASVISIPLGFTPMVTLMQYLGPVGTSIVIICLYKGYRQPWLLPLILTLLPLIGLGEYAQAITLYCLILGIPKTPLFALLLGYTLYRGYHAYKREVREKAEEEEREREYQLELAKKKYLNQSSSKSLRQAWTSLRS